MGVWRVISHPVQGQYSSQPGDEHKPESRRTKARAGREPTRAAWAIRPDAAPLVGCRGASRGQGLLMPPPPPRRHVEFTASGAEPARLPL